MSLHCIIKFSLNTEKYFFVKTTKILIKFILFWSKFHFFYRLFLKNPNRYKKMSFSFFFSRVAEESAQLVSKFPFDIFQTYKFFISEKKLKDRDFLVDQLNYVLFKTLPRILRYNQLFDLMKLNQKLQDFIFKMWCCVVILYH